MKVCCKDPKKKRKEGSEEGRKGKKRRRREGGKIHHVLKVVNLKYLKFVLHIDLIFKNINNSNCVKMSSDIFLSYTLL